MLTLVWHEGTDTIMALSECTLIRFDAQDISDELHAILENSDDLDEFIHRGRDEGTVDTIEGSDVDSYLPWEG